MEKIINGNSILIISHLSDIDGMGSIILGKIAFQNIDYVLMEPKEQKEMLELIKNTNYEQVYICDIAMHDEIGDEISKLNRNILLFDHHQSHTYVNKYSFACVKEIFNNKKTCGTQLFYDYLIKGNLLKSNKALDDFVELIRSYDTWDWQKNNNEQANDLTLLFFILGYDKFINIFSDYLPLLENFSFSDEQLLLIDICKKEMEELKLACNNSFIKIDFENFVIAVVFCERFGSQIGNYICLNNDVDFVLLIDMISNSVSLRSTKDVDVSIIAKKYGGGGHKHAAGFPLNNQNKIMLFNLLLQSLIK